MLETIDLASPHEGAKRTFVQMRELGLMSGVPVTYERPKGNHDEGYTVSVPEDKGCRFWPRCADSAKDKEDGCEYPLDSQGRCRNERGYSPML